MSCFESSTFLRNPAIMRRFLLIDACRRLGWKYTMDKDDLIVYHTGPEKFLHGEIALIVKGDRVHYNAFHSEKGTELATALQKRFQELSVAYAVQTTLKAFEGTGFQIQTDWAFEENEDGARRFFMVAQSVLPGEESATSIHFSVLKNGTIVTDSNYIPHDVHKLADQAFYKIDQFYDARRREGIEIKRKPIPAKYRGKTYCSLPVEKKSMRTAPVEVEKRVEQTV